MTAVFSVVRFDVAPIVIWIFELPLDQDIGAVKVIRILLGFEHGLVVVAIARDGSGYVVGVKVHDPLNYTAGSRKPIAIPKERFGSSSATTRVLTSIHARLTLPLGHGVHPRQRNR